MPLIEKRLRMAVGRIQPKLVYVGGAVGDVYSSAITIPLNALTGGIASAAAAGDLVVAMAFNVDASDRTFTDPGGEWDAKHADLRQGNINFAAFTKRLTVSSSSLTFSGGFFTTHYYAAQVWRGSHAATPIDATPTTAQGSTSGGTNAPSITTIGGSCVVLVGGVYTGTTVSDLSAPADTTNFLEIGDADSSIAMAAARVTAPGAYDPPAFGGGTSGGSPAWCAVSIPIRPA